MVGYIIYKMTRFWLLFQRGKMLADSQTRKRRNCKTYVPRLPDKHHYSRENHLGAALGSNSYWSEYSYEKWRMGKRSLQAGRTCRSTASGKLCSLYVWTKTSIDVFSSNHTQHSRLLEPLENASASIFLPAPPPPPPPTLNARSCRYQLREVASVQRNLVMKHLLSI